MKTIEDLKVFQGAAKPLDEIDVAQIANENGWQEDALRAVIEVESRGSGFDDYKRPKVLFEPHIFYRLLGNTPQRAKAVSQGLAYPKWGEKRYPSDSYPRLNQAIAIDAEKALKSASWGMMQIMGENFKMIGYTSVFDMVYDFMQDEEAHVKSGVNFIKAAGLGNYIKTKNWVKLALGYNGAGYAKNQYPQKLQKAYNKWQKVPDIAVSSFKDYLVENKNTGDPNEHISTDVSRDLSLDDDFKSPAIKNKYGRYAEEQLTKPQIEYIQTRLRNLGYLMVGKVDGIWKKGGSVTAAICALQERCDIEIDGHYGPEVREALARTDGSNRYIISQARKNTTVKDLRVAGSRTIASTDSSKATSIVTGAGLGVMSTGSALVTYAPQALTWLGPIKDFFGDVPIWIYGILGLFVCYIFWWQAKKVENYRIQDERDGSHVGLATPNPSEDPDPVVISNKSVFLPKALRKNGDDPEVDKTVTE